MFSPTSAILPSRTSTEPWVIVPLVTVRTVALRIRVVEAARAGIGLTASSDPAARHKIIQRSLMLLSPFRTRRVAPLGWLRTWLRPQRSLSLLYVLRRAGP